MQGWKHASLQVGSLRWHVGNKVVLVDQVPLEQPTFNSQFCTPCKVKEAQVCNRFELQGALLVHVKATVHELIHAVQVLQALEPMETVGIILISVVLQNLCHHWHKVSDLLCLKSCQVRKLFILLLLRRKICEAQFFNPVAGIYALFLVLLPDVPVDSLEVLILGPSSSMASHN